MKTLKELTIEVDRLRETDKSGSLPKSIKLEVVRLSKERGYTQQHIADTLSISRTSITQWKRGDALNPREKDYTLKHERESNVAFKWGRNGVRFDVRTKCLAVKEFIEEDATAQDICDKTKVSKPSFYGWVKLYRENYKDYLALPDGVPYIVKEEKLLRGLAEIEAHRATLLQTVSDAQAELDKLNNEERTILEKRLRELI